MRNIIEEITDKTGLGKLIEEELPKLENAAGRLADHVRTHPVPYALVGTGLAFLAYRSFSRRDECSAVEEDLKNEARNGAARFRDRVIDPVAHAVSSAGTKARDAAEHFADRASHLKDSTVRTGKSLSDFVERNPWAVGAGIVAVRFLAGLVTRKPSPEVGKVARDAGSDIKKNLRDFLHSVLDERA